MTAYDKKQDSTYDFYSRLENISQKNSAIATCAAHLMSPREF